MAKANESVSVRSIVSYVSINGKDVGNIRKNTNRPLFIDTHKGENDDIVTFKLLGKHGKRITKEGEFAQLSIMQLWEESDCPPAPKGKAKQEEHTIAVAESVRLRTSLLATLLNNVDATVLDTVVESRDTMPPIVVAKQRSNYVLGDGTNRILATVISDLIQSLRRDDQAEVVADVLRSAGYHWSDSEYRQYVPSDTDYRSIPATVVTLSELEDKAIRLNTLHAKADDYQVALAMELMVKRKQEKEAASKTYAVNATAGHYGVSVSQVYKTLATLSALRDAKNETACVQLSKLESGLTTFAKAADTLGTGANKSKKPVRLTSAHWHTIKQCATLTELRKKDSKLYDTIKGESAPSGFQKDGSLASKYASLHNVALWNCGEETVSGIDYSELIKLARDVEHADEARRKAGLAAQAKLLELLG